MRISLRHLLAMTLVGGFLVAPQALGQSFVRTIGSLGSGNGQVSFPVGVAVDTSNGSNIYVGDSLNSRIDEFSATGAFIRIIGSGQLDVPDGIAIDTTHGSNVVVLNGNVNAADNNLISVFTADGTFIHDFAAPGTGNGQLSGDALALAIDLANGGNIVVADTGNNRVEVFSAAGGFIRAFGSAGTGDGQFNGPSGIAIDAANASNIVVADTGNNRIEVFSATGSFIRTIGSPGSANGQLYGPFGIAVDAARGGNVIVSDSGNSRVQVFSPTGTYLQTIGSPGNGNGQLNSPAGVAVDPSNAGNLVVADYNNSRLEVFTDTPPLGPSPLAAAVLPGGRSVQLGTPATVYATLLNTQAAALDGCSVALPGADGLTLDYQTTDPATNALTGQKDVPVTIAGNGSQTFVLTFQAAAATTLQAVPLVFGCTAVAPAPVTPGVDTIDLVFSTQPIADIIALAATAGGNGLVDVPFSQGQAAAFAIASIDAGAAASLTVATDTGAASLPITVTLCQTNPSTGACLAPPSPTVPVTIAAGATPTFSVFVTASAAIPFAPGTSRIFVRFLDAGGNSHGSSSVAVQAE